LLGRRRVIVIFIVIVVVVIIIEVIVVLLLLLGAPWRTLVRRPSSRWRHRQRWSVATATRAPQRTSSC
jgi:cytochrome c oxidase assembly factor CtaG